MPICRGTNRLVWTLPVTGLAIKIPRIRLQMLLWSLRCATDTEWFRREVFRYSSEDQGSMKWSLLKGVLDNWREYCFYREYPHRVLVPTYISIFGLVNIQRLVTAERIDEVLLELICDVAGCDVCRDRHHFSNPANFCLENGRLRILDYGSARTQDILREVADRLADRIYSMRDAA